MKTEYKPVLLLVLAFSACLLAIASCFLVTKWFEYGVTWDPPKRMLREYKRTQEQLPLFGVGPETFSQKLERVDGTGCYVVGMCSPSEIPHRLYLADFTREQRGWIYLMRLIGALGIVMGLISLLLTGLRFRTQFRYLFTQKPARFVVGCLALLLFGILLLLLFGLAYIGPIVSAVAGGNEYPINCHASPPPAIECSYLASPYSDPERVEYELEMGTSSWEFERVLFQGPTWTTFSFVLVAIVWLSGKLWRRQELSTEQS